MTNQGSELEERTWAVVTPGKVVVSGVTYDEAVTAVNQNIDTPGLAVVTKDAAERQEEIQRRREEWEKKNG